MKRIIKDLKLRAGYLLTGLKIAGKPHLMDVVIYKGEEWVLTQGVNNPHWNLSKVGSNDRAERVHVSEFKKPFTFKNLKNSVMGNYTFNMGYWHRINMDK